MPVYAIRVVTNDLREDVLLLCAGSETAAKLKAQADGKQVADIWLRSPQDWPEGKIPQHFREETAFASPGQRVVAKLVDAVLLGVWAAILAWLTPQSLLEQLGDTASWLLLTTAASMSYYLAFECLLPWQPGRFATPGKALMGLEVCRLDASPVPFGASLVRVCAREISVFLLGLPFLLAMHGPLHQAMHDRLSGTMVVRSKLIRRP
jgi:uncharacterized RDD family membrane protein YckC